eukprot:349957-Pelagomonas_calceolata.AAC.1
MNVTNVHKLAKTLPAKGTTGTSTYLSPAEDSEDKMKAHEEGQRAYLQHLASELGRKKRRQGEHYYGVGWARMRPLHQEIRS